MLMEEWILTPYPNYGVNTSLYGVSIKDGQFYNLNIAYMTRKNVYTE